MIKLSDFARQQGVTPRAVQQLLKKYESQIEGHFERRGQNGTWFDETAQDFLRSKMLQKPIVVYDESASPLLSENQDLKHKVDQLKDALTDAYKALADERAKSNETLLQLQIELAEYRLLAAGREEAEQKAADLERRAIEARQRETEATVALEKAEAEIETLSDVAEMNAQEAEKAKAEAAGLKAKYEKFEAAMKEYSKLPTWKRLFVKPPKVEE